jgi:hypothetical protein
MLSLPDGGGTVGVAVVWVKQGEQGLLFVNKKKQKNFLSIGVYAPSTTPVLQDV